MAYYGGSNVMLVRNESSAESLVAMLASCSPVGLQVQRGGGGLEDAVVSCGQKRSYYPTFEASGEEPGEEDFGDDCTQHVESKKRRLSFDQVKSLEKNFEIENKLEPERKIQLAKELGLQPRQVAVWFQNRRARWKTKQLERDYEVLVLDYNRLKTEFEAVLQEKQELEGEVESLTEKTHAAEPGPADLPEKSKRSKASCHLSSEKACEGSVKLERIKVELSAGNDGLTAPCKEEDSKETSSESVSSEILNADSPRTMDSSGSLLPLDNINTYPHISAEMVDSTIIHMSDNLYDQMLSPQTCPRVSVKLEDGSFQDESCNYILAQLDSIEEKGLPWWDWP